MKTLPLAKPALVLTLALSIGATTQVSAALPTGYTYMEPPPPGYGTVQAPPQKTSAPKPSSTPKSTTAPSYAPQYSAPRPQYQPPSIPTYSPPRQQTPQPARRSATAPKPKSTSSASSYGPLPSSHSISLAKLAANDHQQDSRIRRLEGDVANLKSGSPSRFVSANSSPKAHTTYVVRPGDSLWRIASANRVSPGEIMALNHMKSDSVTIGQSLLIPSAAGSSSTTQASYKQLTHSVRAGDTSFVIAKKYGVSRESLRAANPRVDFGGDLIPGSRITIPGKTVRVDTPSSTNTTTGGSYTVKSGDSLKAIAIRHGMSTANLAAANGIKDYNKVIIGQRLTIPSGKSSNIASKSPSKPKPAVNPVRSANDDTIPLPGVGLPQPTMLAPAPIAQTPPPAPKPTAPVSDTHRGVLAYRVDSTDNIESIAQQFGTTPQRIREMNHLQPSTKLNSGDEIMVPAMGAVSVN